MAAYFHGTPVYSPPEVLANARARTLVDRTKHDVYAVGVMLFEARLGLFCLGSGCLTSCRELACRFKRMPGSTDFAV